MDFHIDWAGDIDSIGGGGHMLAEEEAGQKSFIIISSLEVDPIKPSFLASKVKRTRLHVVGPHTCRIKEILRAVIQR